MFGPANVSFPFMRVGNLILNMDHVLWIDLESSGEGYNDEPGVVVAFNVVDDEGPVTLRVEPDAAQEIRETFRLARRPASMS